MVGSAVPDDHECPVGLFSPQPAQDIDGVLAVDAGAGPEPHLALVVEAEAVDGEQSARRCEPEAT